MLRALNLTLLLVACSGSTQSSPGSDAGAAPGVPTDAGGFYAGEAVVQLRYVHLARGTGPVDFCIAPHGSQAFVGPLLAPQGLPGGLPYGSMSQYSAAQPGQLDFLLVAAGAADCDAPLSGTSAFTDLPALSAGSDETVAVILQAGAVAMQIFPDDSPTAPIPAGQAELRALDADSAGPASLDIGLSVDGGFSPWVQSLSPLTIPQAPGIDSNGYAAIPADQGAEISIQSGGQDLLELLPGENLVTGARYSLFAVPPEQGEAIGALLCSEEYPTGSYTPCVLYPQAGEPSL